MRLRPHRGRITPLQRPRRVDRPRHFRLNPDAEIMRTVLHGYHARGVHVLLGEPEMDIAARIERQISGGPSALFHIRLEEPVDQEEYEVALGLYEGRAGQIFEQAAREGRLDRQRRLREITTPWAYLSLDIERAPRGSLAEYQTLDPHHVASMRDIPVRIVGRKKAVLPDGTDVVLCELFEPLPMWLLPTGTHVESIDPAYYSKTAYFVPRQLYERTGGRTGFPWGKLGNMIESSVAGHDVYPLHDPIPFENILRRVPEQMLIASRYLMVLYFIAPILWPPQSYGGKPVGWFRPMREDLAKGIELEVFEGAEWLEGLE